MKRYDQNAFALLVFLCGLNLLLSCTASRKVETVSAIERRDSTYTHYVAINTSVAESCRAESNDTIRQDDIVTGTLKIERDTAGRPVYYYWSTTRLRRSTSEKNYAIDFDFDGVITGHTVDTAATETEYIQKEEKAVAKISAAPENYIGPAILLVVAIYVVYIIIEHLWQNRKQ